MAVKRIRKEITNKAILTNLTGQGNRKKSSVIIGVLALLIIIFLFWYKTATWPVVAMVGWRPITRYEVSQELFKQGGKAVMDDLITRILIQNELKKNNIKITQEEIDAKLKEVEATLGANSKLEDVLAANGTNITDFRKQLELRIGIEKILSDKIAVSEAELNAYLTQNEGSLSSATDEAKRKEATDMLKISKLQTEANTWIEGLKTKARIWTAPGI